MVRVIIQKISRINEVDDTLPSTWEQLSKKRGNSEMEPIRTKRPRLTEVDKSQNSFEEADKNQNSPDEPAAAINQEEKGSSAVVVASPNADRLTLTERKLEQLSKYLGLIHEVPSDGTRSPQLCFYFSPQVRNGSSSPLRP
eukprot:Pompholyxophrys_punicea_v1_NODE_433_length_1979_cov_102.104470.p2 type:complete len:141 gc:universal NODE_433_length_1979_cov_102.104470:1271-1693(+)